MRRLTIKLGDERFDVGQLADGTPIVQDLELSRWLGFVNPRSIRKLIRRHVHELGELVPHRGALPSSRAGVAGPLAGYDLTEHQAIFIAAKSDAHNGAAVLKMMIAVFQRVRLSGLVGSGTEDGAGLLAAVDRLHGMVASERAERRRLEKRFDALVSALEKSSPREGGIAWAKAVRHLPAPPSEPRYLTGSEMAQRAGLTARQFKRQHTEGPRADEFRKLAMRQGLRAWLWPEEATLALLRSPMPQLVEPSTP